MKNLFKKSPDIYKVITMLYNDQYEFEWNDIKASANFIKHGIRFSEAVSARKATAQEYAQGLGHSTIRVAINGRPYFKINK